MAAGTPFKSAQEVLSRSFDATTEGLRAAPMVGSIKAQAATVGVSAALLIATPLAGRSVIMIRPVGSAIYIGASGSVTTANGFQIAADSTLTLEIGDGIAVYAIGGGAGIDVRVLEIA